MSVLLLVVVTVAAGKPTAGTVREPSAHSP
jgi:hypothetical protein